MVAPLIVFDLDGTLVDTAPDLVATLNVTFAREGLPPVEYAAARNMVGGGARMMIERGLAAEGRTLPATEVERIVRDFIAHYAEHIADQSRPFPGVEATLDALAERGFRFAVCTNKLEWLSMRLLDALSLSARFEAVCGPDTFGIAKPNPDFLRRTIVQAGGDPTSAVMVGDSIMDIGTARAAGVPVIGVDFGYTETPIAELGPDYIVSRYADLPAAVSSLLAAPVGELPGTVNNQIYLTVATLRGG